MHYRAQDTEAAEKFFASFALGSPSIVHYPYSTISFLRGRGVPWITTKCFVGAVVLGALDSGGDVLESRFVEE